MRNCYLCNDAYKAHIISTIVDSIKSFRRELCLQGSYNFYYCRYHGLTRPCHAYKAHIISTIVDLTADVALSLHAYKAHILLITKPRLSKARTLPCCNTLLQKYRQLTFWEFLIYAVKSFVEQISYSQNREIEKTGGFRQGLGTTRASHRDDWGEASGRLAWGIGVS